jgi:hypothetical protein
VVVLIVIVIGFDQGSSGYFRRGGGEVHLPNLLIFGNFMQIRQRLDQKILKVRYPPRPYANTVVWKA